MSPEERLLGELGMAERFVLNVRGRELVAVEERAAREGGFVCAAGPYRRDNRREGEMLLGAVRGYDGCRICLVRSVFGIEVWRHRDEMREGE